MVGLGSFISLSVFPWANGEIYLNPMTQLLAADGTHTLTIAAAPFLNYGFNTRAFNGGVPGPTFVMKPGETLDVNLVNNLDPVNNKDCVATGSEFCLSATTNLHTHGLHVSSKGVRDGLAKESDNVFSYVNPGSSLAYSFTIPADHMGGTHWYHPHNHHSTAIQAGGGAAGMIIVKDPVDYLPPIYSGMPEVPVVISGHDLGTLSSISSKAQSSLWANAVSLAQSASKPTQVVLVNGQLSPTVKLTGNTWYRFRMVFAAIEMSQTINYDTARCEINLLAKDGVYLHTIPRDVGAVIMFPGSRADIGFACNCTVYPCSLGFTTTTQEIFKLEVSAGAGNSTMPPVLWPFSPPRPCYLVDLRTATVPAANKGTISFGSGGKTVKYNGNGNEMTWAATHAGGKTMYDWPPMATWQLGQLYEIVIQDQKKHPAHVHVIPYQILALPGGVTSFYWGYYSVGDWHDTFYMPNSNGGDITVRFQTNRFAGKMVVHCHRLEHEDQGMMGYINVLGTEGTVWAGANTLDSTCYETEYVWDGGINGSWSTASTTPNPGWSSPGLVNGAAKPVCLGFLFAVLLSFLQ